MIAALVTGVVVVALLQPGVMGRWSVMLTGHAWKLASTWWMPVGVILSFLVCVAGRPVERGAYEAGMV